MTQTITSTRTTALVRTQPAPAPVPTRSELGDIVAYAQMIADARDALPQSYRKNPGAVVLAKGWADARGLDLLTVLQNVAFVNGRPVVDATMQRALAENAGYRVIVEEATAEAATVKVIDANGQVLGSTTYTIAEARTAGLTGKDNWKRHPAEMLVARATTRALRWHAPSVLLGVTDRDEIDDDGRVSVELAAPPQFEAAPEPDEIIEPEIVDEGEPEAAPAPEPAASTTRTKVQPVEWPPKPEPTPEPEPVPTGEKKMTRVEFSTACRARGYRDTVALRFAQQLDPENPPLDVTAVVDRGRTFCEQVLDAIPRNDGPEQF